MQIEVILDVWWQVDGLNDSQAWYKGQRSRMSCQMQEELFSTEEDRRITLIDGVPLVNTEDTPIQLLFHLMDLHMRFLHYA